MGSGVLRPVGRDDVGKDVGNGVGAAVGSGVVMGGSVGRGVSCGPALIGAAVGVSVAATGALVWATGAAVLGDSSFSAGLGFSKVSIAAVVLSVAGQTLQHPSCVQICLLSLKLSWLYPVQHGYEGVGDVEDCVPLLLPSS